MEAIFSSETSVGFERATRRCIPEDSTLRDNICFAEQVGLALCSGLLFGICWFRISAGTPDIRTEAFRGVLHSLQANAWILL
jgi:hypothetical protein